MAKNVVGVDIGSTSVRAVEIRASSTGIATLVRFLELPFPEGAVNRGEVLEPLMVGAVIKRLWSTGGFTSKKVALGMGNQRVLARDFTVPRASLAHIREALPFEVQDMLPVPVSDALLDFYPISESIGENGPVVHGLLIAAIKDAVTGNVKAIQEAGLSPWEVDLIPFALARVLITRPQITGTVALIEVGANASTVVIATDGVPQFVRIIPAGGEDLTQALKLKLALTINQAEAQKKRLGLAQQVATSEERKIVEILHEVIGELLASLRNTIDYFTTLRSHEPIRQILFTGGGAQLIGFANALAEITKLPVVEADPFTTITLSRSLDVDKLKQIRASITVALGLALGSLE
ncbi:type IV pilus assembly protein PilM [Frigoribacterium sp. CG_9.8]|uniref:type IV pilus assembly protein PilM n=1 Tax=Frigoribacterium sp. CG_9.8 TaxID=2787733 RepID=UPI0018C97BD3|nr:type IV pilus assembly protein PilM [Frigoribacterium sp. CG_9.8]MBG6107948.1 type IV pilus assembly protein PilM [Frigoribacterium sp. CG_9.8]